VFYVSDHSWAIFGLNRVLGVVGAIKLNSVITNPVKNKRKIKNTDLLDQTKVLAVYFYTECIVVIVYYFKIN
jgi:hypothetical protein